MLDCNECSRNIAVVAVVKPQIQPLKIVLQHLIDQVFMFSFRRNESSLSPALAMP